jgi:aminoglycoside 3-N-acetyltransferase II
MTDAHLLHGRSKNAIVEDLYRLGVKLGDTLMIHSSLKAIGPVEDGAQGLIGALLTSVGPIGNLLAYVSWDRSPYEETLDGAQLSDSLRDNWPAFDPKSAGTYQPFGTLNRYLVQYPGAVRSPHPDASMVSIGPDAEFLTGTHPLGHAFGPGSPIERFLQMRGRVLLLGSPLDAVTVLHYAEAVANIPNKRRVSYEMPVLAPNGTKHWEQVSDWDSNGILDCFTLPGEADAVETIARIYVSEAQPPCGIVGAAKSYLIDGCDLVNFGVNWLEDNFAEN